MNIVPVAPPSPGTAPAYPRGLTVPDTDPAFLLRAAQFAAERHRDQRRKGSHAEPYINHPLSVATLLATVGGVEDVEVLAAALLHDTIEDTETRAEELVEHFSARVAELVLAVSDDKHLDKAERKRLQIEHAPQLPPAAQLIKLADKICNVDDVAQRPPNWPLARRREYLDWAAAVVAGCRGVNAALEARFDAVLAAGRVRLDSDPVE